MFLVWNSGSSFYIQFNNYKHENPVVNLFLVNNTKEKYE